MNKAYVQQYVSLETDHWWFAVRKQIIAGFIARNISSHNLSILNIGAAGGASSSWLGEFGKVTSVENETVFIEYLKSTGIDVINASIEKLPFESKSFDLVCAFDVLEHVQDDQLALSEMERVCKDGGMLCITVPAFQSLWGNHDEVNGHKRRYVKQSLKTLFASKPSLNLCDITYFNSILFIPIFFARKISALFNPKNQRSDFENFKAGSFGNRILKAVFGVEVTLLKQFRFPVGVSLIAVLKKKAGLP